MADSLQISDNLNGEAEGSGESAEERAIFIKLQDKVYLAHRVRDTDSLMKLSLCYGIPI